MCKQAVSGEYFLFGTDSAQRTKQCFAQEWTTILAFIPLMVAMSLLQHLLPHSGALSVAMGTIQLTGIIGRLPIEVFHTCAVRPCITPPYSACLGAVADEISAVLPHYFLLSL